MEIKDIRYRPTKYTKKVITKDLYSKWIKEYPEYSIYSYKDFYNFWILLSKEYIDTIVTNTHGVRLSFYMGDLSLKYVTSSNLNRNYKKSIEAKTPTGHLNFITSGKNGKIVWSVDYARKFNSELPLIAFKSCRNFTIKAASAFKNTPELYRITKASKGNIEAILVNNHKDYYK